MHTHIHTICITIYILLLFIIIIIIIIILLLLLSLLLLLGVDDGGGRRGVLLPDPGHGPAAPGEGPPYRILAIFSDCSCNYDDHLVLFALFSNILQVFTGDAPHLTFHDLTISHLFAGDAPHGGRRRLAGPYYYYYYYY